MLHNATTLLAIYKFTKKKLSYKYDSFLYFILKIGIRINYMLQLHPTLQQIP
jgi:hypothetical protein